MTPRLARIAALSPALLAALAGCDDDKKPAPPPQGKRSEVVQATTTATQPATAAPKPTAPKAPRAEVCSSQPPSAGRSLPGGGMAHFEAPGTAPLANQIPTKGRWTWVNLWAAWCEPCKEEIPRLKEWEAKFAQGGNPIHLAFLSLDDDERQARKFLESQPPNGLRASWWLEDGKGRTAWLESLRMKASPQLPVHILLDPQGTVRCVIDGVVEDSDFPRLQALFARR